MAASDHSGCGAQKMQEDDRHACMHKQREASAWVRHSTGFACHALSMHASAARPRDSGNRSIIIDSLRGHQPGNMVACRWVPLRMEEEFKPGQTACVTHPQYLQVLPERCSAGAFCRCEDRLGCKRRYGKLTQGCRHLQAAPCFHVWCSSMLQQQAPFRAAAACGHITAQGAP